MSAPDRPAQGAGIAPHASAAPEIEQLGLLPAESEAARDALLPIAQAAISKPSPQGVGRPVGARNRRTDLMAHYLVQRYGDPLEGHVALGMMDLRALIRELRVIASECGMKLDLSVKDLLNLQADLREKALPYIHAKRAPEDFRGDPQVPLLGILAPGATIYAGAAAAPGRSIEDALDEMKIVQGQEVSAADPAKSHVEKSHDEATD